MALYEHENWGDIQSHIFAKGIITAVDAEYDLADVTVAGYLDGSDVPLFYHCSDDAEERSNGALEGAAAAFSAGSEDDPEDGDEVIVMCEADTGEPVRIIGLVDGIRVCGGWHEPFSLEERDPCTNNYWLYIIQNYNDWERPANAYISQISQNHYYHATYKTNFWDYELFLRDDPYTPVLEAVPFGVQQTASMWHGSLVPNDRYIAASWTFTVDNVAFPTEANPDNYALFYVSDYPGGGHADFGLRVINTFSFGGYSHHRIGEDGVPLHVTPIGLKTWPGETRYDECVIEPAWSDEDIVYTIRQGFSVEVSAFTVSTTTEGYLKITFPYYANVVVNDVVYSQAKSLVLLFWEDRPGIDGVIPDTDHPDGPYDVHWNNWNNFVPKAAVPGIYTFDLTYFSYDVTTDGEYRGEATYFTSAVNGLMASVSGQFKPTITDLGTSVLNTSFHGDFMISDLKVL